jgi:hypothetical protein
VHLCRQRAGERLDRLGVEAQLQNVTGLGLRTSQLGVDRFVAHLPGLLVNYPEHEVGHAADPVVGEGQLVDHVVALGERVTDAVHPLGEALGRFPER